MRPFSPTARNYLASRRGTVARVLIWIEALNRATGAAETIGLWTGDDHRTFSIGGQPRLYYAGGAVKGLEPIRMQTGLGVVTQRVVLSSIASAVMQAIRGYDARFAPIEIHRALFWPETMDLVEAPHRAFKGYIDQSKFTRPASNAGGKVELTLASAARALTITLADKRSDESLRARAEGDTFRVYASDKGRTPWGPNAK